jgi:hypothetical protein
MRALETAAQHLWLGCASRNTTPALRYDVVPDRQPITPRWQMGTDSVGHRQGPCRRLGLLLTMAHFYSTAAPRLQPHHKSVQQLRSLLCSKARAALERVTCSRSIHVHLRSLRTAARAAALQTDQAAPQRLPQRHRRRLALPLMTAAMGLATGGGLALLVACDFDQVRRCPALFAVLHSACTAE